MGLRNVKRRRSKRISVDERRKCRARKRIIAGLAIFLQLSSIRITVDNEFNKSRSNKLSPLYCMHIRYTNLETFGDIVCM